MRFNYSSSDISSSNNYSSSPFTDKTTPKSEYANFEIKKASFEKSKENIFSPKRQLPIH